ncbi:MAG: hypothetical protein A2X18_03185 [Bacteroidetes bacterium GWF2_40_14]|nr:MAG: hypothetical protein A2X18_03185 [Bacteroidetes bacterium GWF2_40_14]
MMDRGQKYLSDILQAIELIEDFTESISNYNEFDEDFKTQSAVERQLGIIGEAVNKFDQLFPENSLENAKKIVGLRNRLIHAYDAIDSSMVWAIVKKHLIPLKQEVKHRML